MRFVYIHCKIVDVEFNIDANEETIAAASAASINL